MFRSRNLLLKLHMWTTSINIAISQYHVAWYKVLVYGPYKKCFLWQSFFKILILFLWYIHVIFLWYIHMIFLWYIHMIFLWYIHMKFLWHFHVIFMWYFHVFFWWQIHVKNSFTFRPNYHQFTTWSFHVISTSNPPILLAGHVNDSPYQPSHLS